MNIVLSKTVNKIRECFESPLYRNSLYITLGRISDAGFGFLFWILAAQLYSVGEVGIATALISSLGLVIAFSRLGFDTALIRFIPSHDHNRVFNTCLWITTVAAFVVGIIYLSIIDFISPEISFIREYAIIFLLFVVVNSITLTTGDTLLSFRMAGLKFVQNLIMGIRVPLLLPLCFLSSLGILYSFGFAYIAAAVFAVVMIRGYVTLSPKIDWEFTQKTFRFSSLNYIASLFQSVPSLVMPILIVTLLCPEDAALYYIAFAIANLVLIIPDSMCTSFFIEGSHGIDLRKGAIRTLATTYAILIPSILFIIFFGDFLLEIFGKEYVAAFDLLKVVTISSLFVTIYNIFIPLQNIRLHVRGIVFISLIRFILLLGLSYIFIIRFGVIGAAYAWGITYLVIGVGISAFAKRMGWI